jgi:hypothetical protein
MAMVVRRKTPTDGCRQMFLTVENNIIRTANRISLPESKKVFIEITSHLSLFVQLLIQMLPLFAEIIPARYVLCSSLQKHRDHIYVQCKGWCQQLGDSKPTALYAYQGWSGRFTGRSLFRDNDFPMVILR